MTSFETWIQSRAALAMANTLLHSLWQAGLAALALAVCLRFIRTSHLRYLAACIALCAIIAAWTGTLFLAAAPAGGAGFERVFYPGAGDLDAGAAGGGRAEAFALRSLLPWITPLWLAGALLFSLRHAASCVAVGRLRRRGVCPAPEAWQQRLGAMRGRLKIARPVMLLESCLTQVPMVVGHLRPVILVPLGLLAGLPAEQVELILMHELAHIRRRDYLVNLLQTFVESAMFYNPAVWWISKTIRSEREHCCDDIAANAATSAHAYAAALTALAEHRSRRSPLAIAATGGNLMKRIRRVLHQPEPAASPLATAIAAVVVIAVIAGLLSARPALQAEPAVTAAATAGANPAPQDPFQIWLDEDAVYIISEEERAAFLSLRTDEERSMFIEQFWRRRDPSPGTAENEFRDEHFRRISYANSNFATLLPSGFGWKSDRGRTYIQWGPPDELEVHGPGTYVRPDGTRQAFASQLWLYRYIEGIGANVLLEFADPNGTSEYSRVVSPIDKQRYLQ